MCALAVRAAESLAPTASVRTMTTSFLRTGRVGPATLSVREVRRGRSMSTMVAELVQDDQLLHVTRLTLMTDRRGSSGANRGRSTCRRRRTACRSRRRRTSSSFGRFELRFDPHRMPFTRATGGLAGYVRPLEARPVDAAWLAMATDWFPPPGVRPDRAPDRRHEHRPDHPRPPQRVQPADDGWLTGSFEIDDSAGGLAVEHGRITLRDGTVVAESFQTRLTAGR